MKMGEWLNSPEAKARWDDTVKTIRELSSRHGSTLYDVESGAEGDLNYLDFVYLESFEIEGKTHWRVCRVWNSPWHMQLPKYTWYKREGNARKAYNRISDLLRG